VNNKKGKMKAVGRKWTGMELDRFIVSLDREKSAFNY
jgi:hypothetical protein